MPHEAVCTGIVRDDGFMTTIGFIAGFCRGLGTVAAEVENNDVVFSGIVDEV